MKFVPRHCQQLMMQRIFDEPRVNLWAEPGMGKTSATLAALDLLWLCGSGFHPALVIAPLRVARTVWAQEAAKWDELRHLRVVPVLGSAADRANALRYPADVYVINFENIEWLVNHYKERWPFRVVVVDESTKLKNFRLHKGSSGRRAHALARIQKGTGRWVNLTGTPAANGYIDLWGQNWFIDRGERLGRTFTAYKTRWFYENVYSRKWSLMPNAEDAITERLNDVTVSLRAEDFFDLDPIVYNTITVDLPNRAMALYTEMESKLFVELKEQQIQAANMAVRTSKCLQIAAGALYTDADGNWEQLHDAKLDALGDLLEESAGGPLLCAYQWKSDLERILKRFPEAREIKSEASIADWNAGSITLGVIHPQSGGHGLNLAEGGHQLVFFSPWWNLEQYLQVIERIGPTRQAQLGRKRPVMAHSIIARSTLDEDVVERLQGKKSVQELLMKRMSARGLK